MARKTLLDMDDMRVKLNKTQEEVRRWKVAGCREATRADRLREKAEKGDAIQREVDLLGAHYLEPRCPDDATVCFGCALRKADDRLKGLAQEIRSIAAEMRKNPKRHPCEACPEHLDALAKRVEHTDG